MKVIDPRASRKKALAEQLKAKTASIVQPDNTKDPNKPTIPLNEINNDYTQKPSHRSISRQPSNSRKMKFKLNSMGSANSKLFDPKPAKYHLVITDNNRYLECASRIPDNIQPHISTVLFDRLAKRESLNLTGISRFLNL